MSYRLLIDIKRLDMFHKIKKCKQFQKLKRLNHGEWSECNVSKSVFLKTPCKISAQN